MSALTVNRNTAEILCHAQKFHRIKTVKSATTMYVGSIGAIAIATGKAEPASDASGLVVAGRVEGFTASGKVIMKTGVFKYDNGTSTEALSLTELNKIVYVIDDHTVGKIGGTNKIPAGILRDIDADGQIVVELGTLTIIDPVSEPSAAE